MLQELDIRKPSDLFGGPRGLVDSTVPPVVFVLVNVLSGLTAAVWSAIGAGAVLLLIRVVRREHVRHAISGFFGVAIAAGIAKATGEAKNYFLSGIVINAFYGTLCLVTAFTKHPVIGFLLRQLSDKPADYHDHPQVRRAYRDVTLGWAAVFFLRVAVQETLREMGRTGWLAVARISMGVPLYLAALALTLPFVNWRTRGVVVADDPHPDEHPLPETPFDEVHNEESAPAD